jgi:hypothetical protein
LPQNPWHCPIFSWLHIPLAVAVAAALESSATIATIVASVAIAGNAVEAAGTMSKQVAVLS